MERVSIMIVDDEETTRNLIKDVSEAIYPDVEIKMAQNGIEARDKLGELPAEDLPEIIFVDYQMPGMNGLELIKGFRRDSILKGLTIVLISGILNSDDLKKAAEALGCWFLKKPFALAEFTRLLSEVRPS